MNLDENNPWRFVEHLRELVPEYKPGVTSPYADATPAVTPAPDKTPIEASSSADG